ncbi:MULTISPECIES: response regulator transcription factor [Paenibacillus]|uniref:Heme response regulator HssR n=1 Tax=Paenibacillus violae TaxID=3077234 RepID=A0ABU3RIT5_9BACL|nr:MULTISPECIES: response regulator transcription factor [Paenibacillus]MDU0203934.1 response regulator transcription factor [Paenibacillus sp. PFR10]MEC0269219.1 response regulator transcription factor [Paenibacillus anseongense]
MSKILIVDDDAHIRELMSLFLQNEGFDVIEAENGEQAISLLENTVVELVILDIMMPLVDGWDLCKEIRKRDPHILLLMVTAKGESAHKVKGFQLGTDDYLAKPFDPVELVLRIKALLKRSRISSSKVIQLGEVLLNLGTYKVVRGNEEQALPLKEFELLFKLASYPGQIFTREQLITQIWGMDYEGDDRTVDVHIKRLRQRFASDIKHFYIETARGLGYRLVVVAG